MSRYELRAQEQPADPVGQETVRWHILREGSATALCGHFFSLVSATKPITEILAITPPCRCRECWDWWAVVEQVRAGSSAREPGV
ncbi:hypothetical protein [Streptacidiphilus rugosus]|uniref:hypothetical protein n=1 Tax=Streptacidiphilus rugosus TaxID=405783 RepID=UPI00056B2C0A|nr:hypothetical protein [Streptacidiphilus rugosus]